MAEIAGKLQNCPYLKYEKLIKFILKIDNSFLIACKTHSRKYTCRSFSFS